MIKDIQRKMLICLGVLAFAAVPIESEAQGNKTGGESELDCNEDAIECFKKPGPFSPDILAACVSNTETGDIKQINLLSGLGNNPFPLVSMVDEKSGTHDVESYYSQGMTLQYAFNFPRAIRAFLKATEIDDKAAMAYWGIALSANSNINSKSTNACVTLAYAAATKAKELADGQKDNPEYQEAFTLPERDRQIGYAAAFLELYEASTKNPAYMQITKETKRAYAGAMKELSKTYPEDLNAATLHADTLLNIDPWMWWIDGEAIPDAAEALGVLDGVLEKEPLQIGANHLYIHGIEEAPTLSDLETGIPMADRLMSLVPSTGHLTHMPSHIYQRIGENADSSAANVRAVQVDRYYLDQLVDGGRVDDAYPLHYLGHNIHFLVWTLSIEGRENESLNMAKELIENTIKYSKNDFLCKEFPELIRTKTDYFFAAAYYFAVRFQNWDKVEEFRELINTGVGEINTTCGWDDDDKLEPPLETPYTDLIYQYADSYRKIDEARADPSTVVGVLSSFWNETHEKSDFLSDSEIGFAGYGSNRAIDLIRITNITLVNRLLIYLAASPTLGNESVTYMLINQVMRNLEVPNKLIGDISPVLKDSAPIRTPIENNILLWQEAIEIQDNLNYNEPPDWYYTTRESLGFSYLAKSNSSEDEAANMAEETFKQDLNYDDTPNDGFLYTRRSGRSLFGLIQSQTIIQGKPDPEAVTQFNEVWRNANIGPDMNLPPQNQINWPLPVD